MDCCMHILYLLIKLESDQMQPFFHKHGAYFLFSGLIATTYSTVFFVNVPNSRFTQSNKTMLYFNRNRSIDLICWNAFIHYLFIRDGLPQSDNIPYIRISKMQSSTYMYTALNTISPVIVQQLWNSMSRTMKVNENKLFHTHIAFASLGRKTKDMLKAKETMSGAYPSYSIRDRAE